jgi:hypothetical protein
MSTPKDVWVAFSTPSTPKRSRFKEIFLGSEAMSTPGITRGCLVHLIERRGEQNVQHDALVLNMSMAPEMSGTRGEMAIDAVFVNALRAPSEDWREDLMLIRDVVHLSHHDWIERRTCIAYEEVRTFVKTATGYSFGVIYTFEPTISTEGETL